jgi:hypothetical protein
MAVAGKEQPEPPIFLSLSLVTGKKSTGLGGPGRNRARGVVDITWWHTARDSAAGATGEGETAPNRDKQPPRELQTPEKNPVARELTCDELYGAFLRAPARRGSARVSKKSSEVRRREHRGRREEGGGGII